MISCKGCGANMRFDPVIQMLKCDYCGKTENAENLTAELESGQMEMFDTTMFTCPQCGATLFSDDDTTATFCSYCGSSVIIEGRAVKMKAPSYVIPFKVPKERAEALYRQFIGGAVYAPDYMKEKGEIKKLRGIYMPYWIYEMGMEGPVSSTGSTSRRSGDYIYTRHYRLTSNVRSHSNGTSFDASSAFSDELSMAIAPYNFRDSKSFSAGYLSGFYVDSADVEDSVYARNAREVFAEDIARRITKYREYATYSSRVSPDDLCNRIVMQNKEMAYFPVWFIANESKGYVSYAVINGQTGKVAADVPIDYKKYIIGSLLLSLPIMLGVGAFVMFSEYVTGSTLIKPAALAIATIIFSLISWIISNNQLNLLYTRLQYLDDEGLKSVRGEQGKGIENKVKKPKNTSRKPTNPYGTVSGIMFVVGGILFSAGLEGLPAMALLGFVAFIVAVVLNTIGRSTAGVINSNSSVSLRNKIVYKMPFSEKIKVIIKPMIAMALSFLLLIINPYEDTVYYVAVLILMAFVLFTFKDVVEVHNKLTRRLPRQFGKRGGDESEI